MCDSPWLNPGTAGFRKDHDWEYEDGELMEEPHCNRLEEGNKLILRLREVYLGCTSRKLMRVYLGREPALVVSSALNLNIKASVLAQLMPEV